MNAWVQYIDRSFSSIKTSILDGLSSAVPELTDRSSSNLLMVIVDIFSGVAELTNYYIDVTARELFLPTARRLSSVIKLANLANYNGKARTAAHTAVTFTAKDATNETIENPTAFNIPAGIILTDANGNQWTTQHNQIFRLGYKTTQISVSQYESIVGSAIGISDGSVSQGFLLPTDYKDSSLAVTIGGDSWELVEGFGFSSATDKHCIAIMLSDGLMYVMFGDGVNGLVPTNGAAITSDYHSTRGVSGNTTVETITTITTSLTLPGGVDHLDVTNPTEAYGGRDIEGIEEIRRATPIALRTLSRAVTRKDYEDVAILSADIRAARVEWNCGARLDIYLVSHGGGNPSVAILSGTEDFIQARSMMTIAVTAHPSGETVVRGKVSIVGRFRALASVIEDKTEAALQELYNPYTSLINQDIRTSDIIAAIDNIPEVDYLSLDYIYAQPYLRPSNPAAPLDYTIEISRYSIGNTLWQVVYDPDQDGAKPFFISREGTYLVNLAVGETATLLEGYLTITINTDPSATQDDHWDFTVYPYNQDIDLDDLSIPVSGPGDFIIDVDQTYVSL